MSEQVTEYSIGFLFSTGRYHVALIRKEKPDWQKGKWNGIGGHIEPKESSRGAMVREFEEETGVYIASWEHFCTIGFPQAHVHVFRAFSEEIWKVRSTTVEQVGIFSLDELTASGMPTIPNVPWLILMALSMDKDRAYSFIVQEVLA